MVTINAVSTNFILKMNFRLYLSYTASYKNLVERDSLFIFVKYDLRVSEIGAKNMSYRGTASSNETEYQPMAMTAPDGIDDVPGTIHPGEDEQEIDHAAMSLPTMESVGGN